MQKDPNQTLAQPLAFLTRYDGLLCGDCALSIDDLVDGGRRWLLGLTAIPVADVLRHWPGDLHSCRCEECERRLNDA